jgi:hypothetical protein
MLQPTSSADEIAGHLANVPPCAIFLSQDLLALGQDAIRRSTLPLEVPMYRLSVPVHTPQGAAVEPDQKTASIPTLDDLIASAKDLPAIDKTTLSANEAARRVAYFCTTSGTSGFQVKFIAHYVFYSTNQTILTTW